MTLVTTFKSAFSVPFLFHFVDTFLWIELFRQTAPLDAISRKNMKIPKINTARKCWFMDVSWPAVSWPTFLDRHFLTILFLTRLFLTFPFLIQLDIFWPDVSWPGRTVTSKNYTAYAQMTNICHDVFLHNLLEQTMADYSHWSPFHCVMVTSSKLIKLIC